ncbi:MAG: hypothetical protein KDJ52_25700 [Anaerolineae bacterium]|nr:hypothetical protein [Anaerolineae bacterium]
MNKNSEHKDTVDYAALMQQGRVQRARYIATLFKRGVSFAGQLFTQQPSTEKPAPRKLRTRTGNI